MNLNETQQLKILQWILFLILAVPAWTLVFNSYDSGIAKLPLFFLLSCLLLSLGLAFAIMNGELLFIKSPADITVLLFLCAGVFSLLLQPVAMNGLETLKLWFGYGICYFAGTHLFRDDRDFVRLAKALVVIGAVVCALGAIQYFIPNSSTFDFFLGEGNRVGSTLGNPIYLSGFIVALFPLLLSYFFFESNRSVRLLLFMFCCGLLLLLVATQSRGSTIAIAVSMFFFLSLSQKIKRTHRLGIMLFLAGVAVLLFLPQVSHRFESLLDQGSTFARRVVFWKAGIGAMASSPLMGHGAGSYEETMREFRDADYWMLKSEDIVPHAHNEFLEIGVELGFVGLALFLTVVVVVMVNGMTVWKKAESDGRRTMLLVGLLSAVVGVLVDNLANVSLRQPPIGALFWLSMGVIISPIFAGRSAERIKLRIPKYIVVLPLALWGIVTFIIGQAEIKKIKSDHHLIHGVLAKAQGNKNDAIAEFNASVQSYPGNLKALENLSVTLLQTNRAEEALTTVQELQRLSPGYPKSRLIESLALASMRRYSEAGNAIEKEIARRDHPEAFYAQALIRNGLHEREGELRSVTMALRRNIAGGTNYNLESMCQRLVELSTMVEEREVAKTLLEELRSRFPTEKSILQALKRVTGQ